MTIEESIAWGQQSLLVVLAICAPPLLAALVIGFVVSLLQAVTQIQEMTLSYVPKVLGAVVVVMGMGNWMLTTIVKFTLVCFDHAFQFTK